MENTSRNEFASAAFRALELAKLEPISAGEVLSLTVDQAWERIAPHFADLPPMANGEYSTIWTSKKGAIRGLLGQNYKLEKDDLPTWIGHGVKVLGLSLAPSTVAAQAELGPVGFNVCAFASKECRESCLKFAGRNVQEYPTEIQIRKTLALIADPVAFVRLLIAAVARESRLAFNRGELLAVRLNVLADVPWEVLCPWLFQYFQGFNVVFYDYTKIPGRVTPENYDLTFSATGRNDYHVSHELARGLRIAVVFPKGRVPSIWRGLDVVDGDKHDFRIADRGGIVVGLGFKTPLDGNKDRDPAVFIASPEDSRRILPVI